MIPAGRQEAVLEILDDEGIDYAVSDEVSAREYTATVRFPLPSTAVESVLDRLSEAGIGDDVRVVVIDAETVVSEEFATLRSEYGRGESLGGRISRQELQARAAGLTPTFSVYAAMTLISAVVATSGLLLDSPAVVVGSMVIAPLIGPALAASVGIVVDDDALRSTGLSYQCSGIAIAVLGSIVLAGFARMAGLEPAGIDIVAVAELEERVAPNLLALLIALGAGVAGILSLTRELSEAIVGVMIAAALIPPAAAVGVALAWGMYGAAAGATVLVLVNALSINLAALLTLWIGGYRPPGLFAVTTARRRTIAFVTILGAAMVLLLVPLLGATLVELEATQLESDVATETDAVLEDPAYAPYDANSVSVELDDDYPVRSVDRIAITIDGPDTETRTDLVERLVAAIDPLTEEPLAVEIQFVDVEHERTSVDGDAEWSFPAALRSDRLVSELYEIKENTCGFSRRMNPTTWNQPTFDTPVRVSNTYFE
ncbi:hypothetical protein C446_03611, partial [Halobiforma nitratireducens JCM 10879]